MYLKSIEMMGFKSFPTKTKAVFEDGVSCIVGPNGSGKSNISDALRWVLGEQNARNLRGGKQEDVIFSGSKKRKALGMAEVTLLLDNSDGSITLPFSEIAVTRRTFRGGGSEYLLNGSSCRLKDIIDLFADTGIGADSLSLISQGQVNELISAKPDERRSFVEETAGIVKFRNRKKEATRKLNETEQNLQRVADIIYELNNRLPALQEQARKAQNFKELQAEADNTAITLAVRVLSEFEDKLKKQLQAMAELEDLFIGEDTQRLNIAAQRAEWKNNVSQLDQEVAALAAKFYDLQGQKEKIGAEKTVLDGQIANHNQNRQRLNADLANFSQTKSEKETAAQALAAHVQATTAELDSLKQEILAGEGDSEEFKQAVIDLQNQLQNIKEQAFDFANQLANQRNKLAFQQQLWEKNQQALQRLKQQREEIAQTLNSADNHMAEFMLNKENIKKEAELAQNQIKDQQQHIKDQNQKLAELAAKETETRYRAHSLNVRINMLLDMQKNYEGFFPGVKALLTAKAKDSSLLPGICDAVANLLEVPPKFQIAIEHYLGASLQNIIALSEKEARQAISYLKKHELGRATFLPLDTIRPRRKGDIKTVAAIPGVFGLASELITCPSNMQVANDFLLNQVLLVEDMDTAAKAAKILDYRLHIVTLDGDMINPGGSLAGGSKAKKNNDILGKKLQLKKAEAEYKLLHQQLEQEVDNLNRLRSDVQEQNIIIEEMENQIKHFSHQQLEIDNEIKTIQQQVAALKRQDNSWLQDMNSLEDELILIEEEQNDIKNLMLGAEDKEAEFTAKAADIAEKLNVSQAKLEQDREGATSQKVKMAAQEQKLIGQQKSLALIEQEIEDIRWEQENKDADLRLTEQQLAMQSDLFAKKEADLIAITEEIIHIEADLNTKRHGLAAETTNLGELEKKEQDLTASCRIKQEKLHQMELYKTRMEADCDNERQKLAEQFALSLDEALQTTLLEGSRSALQTRLSQLKRQINGLGNINLDAIEEFAEVSERHQFLNTQREDLLKARKQLDQVIAEMDEIMSSRFSSTFAELSRAFDFAFNRLFGGGQAALVMTEPENLLSTGVDLAISLPGKKISNYNLLSGGEKALIGMALMFAALTVKPSPFCVMDEVDAALDEANIDRFTVYLRELAAKSQFVMISHRQGTMEAADNLWGVTMEEDGVSKLISVRLQGKVS